MNGDDGELPKPGQNNQASAVPHSELAPGEAVSLRETPARVGPGQPAFAPAGPVQTFSSPLADDFAGLPSAADTNGTVAQAAEADNVAEIEWTASEFIAHPKGVNWYLALVAVTVVVLVIAWLIGHDAITSIVIIICAILFGLMASRQPRQLQYAIGTNGVNIGSKFYPYHDFRSFALVPEGAFSSIDFMPLKRFAPVLSIYFDPNHETNLVTLLAEHLPVSAHKRTMIDDLMHRIRF